ncbi:MAG: hypothetical protein M3458_02465 [Acidobacteriota bacterium]|nr:hypothetical protein [Acidobacteriota bacterium]
MRGISTDARHEPRLNPSWKNPPRAEAPGWGINGPGVSAEWSQGGESEWNSVAASADESRATIYQEIEIPRTGAYRVWVRYADWLRRTESFSVTITQGGREVFRRQFGARSVLDAHDETGMYWGWAFVWDGADIPALGKGAARIALVVEGPTEARRHVDCVLVTDDPAFVPEGRAKPPFAATRVLQKWGDSRPALRSLLDRDATGAVPKLWARPRVAGRDFLMPWNISMKFWESYDKPPAERLLYPFHAEAIDEFVAKYKGAREVPLFDSKMVVPVIYINDLATLLKEGSPFLRYLRETRAPFAVLINYGTLQMPEADGQAAWKLLAGELREQFIGWISGESIGYVYDRAPVDLKLSPTMSRRELLEAHRVFYTRGLEAKWGALFHSNTGPMWNKLIPAQVTSTTTYAHALGRWGTKLIGIETAAVQPMTAMRAAFVRGAARQYGGAFLYYHAPNFGDTATTFTKMQNFAGPDHFFHTRYGASMGPSLSWYRKSYYLYYMAGASAIYLEQGFDQFFKPGPGEHPLQLNPLGRITEEFMRFAEAHPERGTPYTPVAILLDPAHGWEMTDYPHLPFSISAIDRHDRALRELFGAAYFPGLVAEGEPATSDRQAFVSGVFGDIFDVLVASDESADAINAYRVVVAGGRIEWTPAWGKRLSDYVRGGGVVMLNAAQAKGLPEDLLGVRLTGQTAEADGDARCRAVDEAVTDLSGQAFRYERVEPRGAEVLIDAPNGDALVTVNKLGRGRIVFCAVPDLLGLDERLTPVAAHLLTHLFGEASPVRVVGDVEFLINRTAHSWVVTLINNRGVFKPQQGMAQVDRRARVDVEIGLRGGQRIERASEWTDEGMVEIVRASNDETIKLHIAPGDVRVIELIPKR